MDVVARVLSTSVRVSKGPPPLMRRHQTIHILPVVVFGILRSSCQHFVNAQQLPRDLQVALVAGMVHRVKDFIGQAPRVAWCGGVNYGLAGVAHLMARLGRLRLPFLYRRWEFTQIVHTDAPYHPCLRRGFGWKFGGEPRAVLLRGYNYLEPFCRRRNTVGVYASYVACR